jgi:hypothetical protein
MLACYVHDHKKDNEGNPCILFDILLWCRLLNRHRVYNCNKYNLITDSYTNAPSNNSGASPQLVVDITRRIIQIEELFYACSTKSSRLLPPALELSG